MAVATRAHAGAMSGGFRPAGICLYLNGYIGKLAAGPGLMMFMRGQLGKPVPSPVVLGQVSEKFREAVKALAERECIPFYQFRHKERKDDTANDFRRQRQGLKRISLRCDQKTRSTSKRAVAAGRKGLSETRTTLE